VVDDPSRTGPDRGTGDVSDQRVVRVLIRRPAGVSGPLPAIVFAHGYDTDPDTYGRLLDAWAADGYLVAAPDLPGSSDDLPGAPVRDIGDQATDLSLVLTALLDGRAGQVDPSRLIAAGHSDGGSAVAALAMNSSLVDPRFGTYMVLSGAIADQVTNGTWGPGPAGHRMLVMVGENDEYGNVPAASEVWSTAALRGAGVVVPGGDHEGMYVDDSPLARRVRAATVEFLNSQLSRPS
jgi:acetyl esterase/lipase